MRSGNGWLELCALHRSIPQSTKSTTSLDEDRRTSTRRSDGTNASSERSRRGALSMYQWSTSRQQENGRSATVGETDDDKSPGVARDRGHHSQPSRQERIWRESAKSTNKPAWKEPEPVSQTVINRAGNLSRGFCRRSTRSAKDYRVTFSRTKIRSFLIKATGPNN